MAPYGNFSHYDFQVYPACPEPNPIEIQINQCLVYKLHFCFHNFIHFMHIFTRKCQQDSEVAPYWGRHYIGFAYKLHDNDIIIIYSCTITELKWRQNIIFVSKSVASFLPWSASVYSVWHSFRIFSITETLAESVGFAELRCFTLPDMLVISFSPLLVQVFRQSARENRWGKVTTSRSLPCCWISRNLNVRHMEPTCTWSRQRQIYVG